MDVSIEIGLFGHPGLKALTYKKDQIMRFINESMLLMENDFQIIIVLM